MPERIEGPQPDAQTVSASNTALFKLPIGPNYHELQITLGGTGTLLADIDEIRVIVNEIVIHRYNFTERDSINQFDGRAAFVLATNPVLVIPFDRYAMENSVTSELTSLDTGRVSPAGRKANPNAREAKSLLVEIDINAGWPGDGTMKIAASTSASSGMGIGTVLHVGKTTRAVGGAEEKEYSDLPFGDVRSQALSRVHFRMSANDISRVKATRNNVDVFDRTKAVNESIQLDGVRVPQAGMTTIDRTERGFSGNTLDLRGVQDFRYKLTTTGAATITVISEYIGALGR
ncbi:MAG: hypothetical protein JKY86_07675 [Gammaproteobacteria bacterium]|nr:hypothetical protein [Gammaproteobacteria bacterium]MBL4572938.1 hypothetical protein [Gammaproteobacteria bacterium]